MNMPTQKKIELVDQYALKFKQCKSIFLADFTGMNVAQVTELRRQFRKAKVEYCVLKNTLAKRSLKNAGIEGLDQLLKGMTSFAYSEQDATAPIKVIKDFNKTLSKEQKSLVVKGCVFEGRIFGADKVEALTNLPSREVLLAQLVGMLQSPLSRLLLVLQASGQKLVGVLTGVKETKS
jgi:large subunit ribosomal protein L10